MRSSDLRLVYTVAEFAELLGIGRSTAYELVARGERAITHLGGRVMVTPPDRTPGCRAPATRRARRRPSRPGQPHPELLGGEKVFNIVAARAGGLLENCGCLRGVVRHADSTAR
jgi:excisionase family DNA binding protein